MSPLDAMRDEIEAYAKACREFSSPRGGTYLRGRYDATIAVAGWMEALLSRYPQETTPAASAPAPAYVYTWQAGNLYRSPPATGMDATAPDNNVATKKEE